MMLTDENNRIVMLIEGERVRCGISIAELGRRLDIDRKRLWNVLRLKRAIRADEFVKLCAYFDLGFGRFAGKKLRDTVAMYRRRDRIV